MTVSELIELLEDFDPDSEVRFEISSGDYWRSVLALPVGGVDDAIVEYSRYHDEYVVSDKPMDELDLDDDQNAPQIVVLLRSNK